MKSDERYPPPSAFGLPEKFSKWRPEQILAIERSAQSDKRFTCHALPTGCVTGDTLIHINRARNGSTVSIERAFLDQTDGRRRAHIESFTRSLKGDFVGLQKVNGIAHSGLKETWRLRLLDGSELRATADHKIATRYGYLPLAGLREGIEVICDTLLPVTAGIKSKKHNYPRIQGLIYHPFSSKMKTTREGRMFPVPTHRLVVEAHLNSLSLDDFVSACRTDREKASTLFFLDPQEFAIHHKNKNSVDFRLDNLELMTHAEHKKIHADYKSFGQGKLRLVPVASVARTGFEEETYDVMCADPFHNFVANGMVIHNSGKSLAGVGLAKLMGLRVAYLTSTKGLQRQMENDFGGSGLVDIRGQNNYRCRLLVDDGFGESCDHGPCHAGFACEYRSGGCDYYDAVKHAKQAESVVTNYKYWVKAHKYSDKSAKTEEERLPLGKFDLLVLDECHNSPDELSSALSFSISKYDVEALLASSAPWQTEEIGVWTEWASISRTKINTLIEECAKEIKEDPTGPMRRRFKLLRDLGSKLADLAALTGSWVADIAKGEITLSPVWPSHYSSQLFRDVPKITLLSATVRPKTADLVGIPQTDMDFYEYDSSFPASARPVYHVPTVRMNHKTTEGELATWLLRMDQIIGRRLDRKGIIHTVSYDRRNFVVTQSSHSKIMFSHDSKNTAREVARFKSADPPAVLVSPSVSTGWDFPFDECRYQIIGKLAFIDTRNKIAKARCDADPEYSAYIAMQELIQASGRGMRDPEDYCETIVIDDNIKWFMKRHKSFAPRWFLQAFKYATMIPDPPPLKG